MKVRSLFLAALCTGLFSAPVFAQRDFSAVQIEATHVAGSVWMLVGSGGNIGVSSGPDGVVMVDDQFAPLADKIRDALREVGQSEGAAQPQFLINTHFHGDHTGGNVEFGEASTIVAHTNVRTRLAAGGSPDVALPVVTFDDALSIHFNGEEIRAFHIPHGHTDGDALIYFTGSNVLHMGDDFFAGRFPFVDIDNGGNVEGLASGISQVLDNVPADIRIIPGHGPLSTVDDLRTYHRMITETIAMVRGKIDAGLSSEQVQSEGVSEEWADWGAGFISTERWLDTVHRSLSGAAGGEDVEHGHSHGHH
ncbi:MAG: MBL fold metallo-hydrolase [Gemmatimonadales bacterium]|nr:MBL fold metallo-hydrolase [Candidatus Palauibacter irciniicola]MYC17830.1 MBL fold metallo-hydrolase [Gemmatimonadales bacterium]